jgi:hypothetical protein
MIGRRATLCALTSLACAMPAAADIQFHATPAYPYGD